MNFMETIRFWLDTGGVTAWIIVVTSLILIVTAFERITFLFVKYSFRAEEALNAIRTAVLARDYTKALQVCNSNLNAAELNVVKAGLLAVENGREAMKSALGGAVLDVSRACEKRVPIIGLIAAVSTLLGLFGTITGLIKTFAALAQADAAAKAQLLGSGISEAMYSTASGLALGIVAMVIHSICTTKGDEIVGNAQGTGYRLVTWVEQSERSSTNG